jgi:hypothetical protein
MLSLALVFALHAAPGPVCAAPPPAPRVQGRRGRRSCHSEGMKCDTGSCCKGLKCVEEIVGKVCRKDGED